jgi:ribosomal subunit interface protein
MEVVVTGRQCTISQDMKEQVGDRLSTIEKLRDRLIRAEVEFQARGATKDPEDSVVVQITLRSKGPVIRAEGRSSDKMVAFEGALDRLKTQLRKAADRRKTHRGLRPANGDLTQLAADHQPGSSADQEVPKQEVAGLVVTGDGPLVVREKVFEATPLTLAQALDEMELVGHDFFLYEDAETGRPSVVYRRKAYNYGVIHLDVAK